MLQQRYDYDLKKRNEYVFLRIPLDATLMTTIEIASTSSNGIGDVNQISYTSPQFPSRFVKNGKEDPKNNVLLSAVDNSNCLKSDNLGSNVFRFIYYVNDSVDNNRTDDDYVFMPVNGNLTFTFAYGTQSDFSIGLGGTAVSMIYYFGPPKYIVTSWMLSPWRVSWSVNSLREKLLKKLSEPLSAIFSKSLENNNSTDNERRMIKE